MCDCKTRPRLMLADARRRDDCVIVAVQLKDCLEKKDPRSNPPIPLRIKLDHRRDIEV